MKVSNYHYNLIKAILFFRRSANWSRQQILDYQNSKLIEMVQHAGSRVPYYKKLFEDAGIDIQTFKGIVDMHKIPLLDKEEIRKNPEMFLADNYMKFGGEFTKTSGSTGTPLRLHIDNISKAFKYAAVIRAYNISGYKLYSKALLIQGYSATYSKPYGYRVNNNSLFFNAIRNSEDTFLKFYPLLMKHRPEFIFGYARAAAQMCRYIEKNNLKFPKIRAIVNHGEFVPESDINYLADKIGCKYFDLYSMTENAVMIHMLENQNRYLTEDYFYPEIVGQSGRIVDKSIGELVGTSFYNYSMPLIRYKTRDIVELQKDSSFTFNEVKSIVGRKNDKIILPDGTEVLFAEDAISLGQGKVRAAQYIQEKGDELQIHVIVDDDFNPETFKDMESVFRKRLGDSMKYSFRIVSELEKRGDGKIPFMINRLTNRQNA